MLVQAKAKITLQGIRKTYHTEGGKAFEVLQGISLEVLDREFVVLIGPSGCGKTTLLHIVAGLLKPTAGHVFLDLKEVTGPGPERGMVFQQDAILMWRKVLANVEYGLELRGIPRNERRRIAFKHLETVGLGKFKDFFPKELSGGMKKRVQVATVFANNPDVLLMDEPFGSLDYPTKVSLQDALLKLWMEEQKTTLFVTHDVEEAIFLADRILIMQEGKINRVVTVPFGRPRKAEIRTYSKFRELLAKLWLTLSNGPREA